MSGPSDVERFARRAETYGQGWRGEFHRRLDAASLELVRELGRPRRILDVGCGTGALLRALAREVEPDVTLVGIDPAPAMVQIARETPEPSARIRFDLGHAEALPYDDASFELALSTVAFHHWSDRARGIAEMARVLQPGGRLLLIDHFATGWLRGFDLVARRQLARPAEVEDMLATAGLRLEAWRRVYDVGPLPLIRACIARQERATHA